MSKHGFLFLGSEQFAKFILSHFDFRRLLQEPWLPSLRQCFQINCCLAPNLWREELNATLMTSMLQRSFNSCFTASVLQEVITFNIFSHPIAQDLSKSLGEFRWESFELWFDANSASLVACQNIESGIGASPSEKRVKSFNSSWFPLPYPWGIPPIDSERLLPREKRRAYPTNCMGRSVHKEPGVALECRHCSPRRQQTRRCQRN